MRHAYCRRHLAHCLAVAAFALAGASGCGPTLGELESLDEPVATHQDAVSTCYCPAPHTCGFSSSPSYMYPAARDAMQRAGVTNAALIQTFGDAEASVGTHCPEPGAGYSAATDFDEGSTPCARTRSLRMQGFAAWYRVPPAFGTHIHAVYAGTPSLKSSLKNQLASFAQGRNGLASNAVETVCPITQAEKDAVAKVRAGGVCVAGGEYCGGDKVKGSPNTLYRCNSDGVTATELRVCPYGCSVNPGKDDSCKPAPPVDAGVNPDAGVKPDAGVVIPDAGPQPADGGDVSTPDAGLDESEDAGQGGGGGGLEGPGGGESTGTAPTSSGCGCNSGASGLGWTLALLALSLTRRRLAVGHPAEAKHPDR